MRQLSWSKRRSQKAFLSPYSPFPFPQEALPTGRRQGPLPREQSQISHSPQDKSLTSETEVPVTTATLSFFPSQTLPNETQVVTITLAPASRMWQPQALVCKPFSSRPSCRSVERDRYGRVRQYRRSLSRNRDRRRRHSRDEDKFKGSLSEGMKVDQESSEEEVWVKPSVAQRHFLTPLGSKASPPIAVWTTLMGRR